MTETAIQTNPPSETPESSSIDREKLNRVRKKLRAQSRAFRWAHPWVDKHQNAIGLSLMIASVGVMIGFATLYFYGLVPGWLCVIVIAMAMSIAHELEHDNIHNCYFRDRKWVQNLMLGTGWVMRPSTLNPWVRRDIHLQHHRISGTENDVEERGITNGDKWGPTRLLALTDNFLAVMIHSRGKGAWAWLKRVSYVSLGFFPMGFIYYAILLTFIGTHAYLWVVPLLGGVAVLPAVLQTVLPVVNFLAVVWILPEALRSFCLKFISSNMHYYGNIEVGDVMRQTQVLNHPIFLPFQLFCFNFGSTHGIHHIWVPEPFYIRQATARAAHEVMREEGVPFNDLGTFARANRYDWTTSPA